MAVVYSEPFTGSDGAALTTLSTVQFDGASTAGYTEINGNRAKLVYGNEAGYGSYATFAMDDPPLYCGFTYTYTTGTLAEESFFNFRWKTDFSGNGWILGVDRLAGVVVLGTETAYSVTELASTSVSFSNSQSWKVRVEYHTSGVVRFKHWLATDDEPMGWTAQVLSLAHPSEVGYQFTSGGGDVARTGENPWFVDDVVVYDFAGEATTAGLVVGSPVSWVGTGYVGQDDGAVTTTGEVAVTLANFTSSASGSTVTGTAAPTLAAFTSSASATHSISGTVAVTLADFTSDASGTFTNTPTGTVAATLDDFTSTASGASTTGTSAQTLAAFTSDASGVVAHVAGTVDVTLEAWTGYGTGTSTTGTSATTLAALTAAATGAVGASGSSAVTLDAFTSSAAGTHSINGTASPTLDAFTSDAAGSTVTGTSTTTLDAFVPTATGIVGEATGTVSATLDAFTCTASGNTCTGVASSTLANFTSDASGSHTVSGSASPTLANFTSSASGNSVTGSLAITLASFTSDATGAVGASGTIAVTLASYTSEASGSSVLASAAVVLDAFTSAGVGVFGVDNATPAGANGRPSTLVRRRTIPGNPANTRSF